MSFKSMKEFAPLGDFGCDLVENQVAFSSVVSLVCQPDAFRTARPRCICCMDDRPEYTISEYINVPGAEVLPVLMSQFVFGGSFAQNMARLEKLGYSFCSHADCYGRGHADRVLKEVVTDPTHELAMLDKLRLGKAFAPSVYTKLGNWLDQLPGGFATNGAASVTATSPVPQHNPIVAIINRGEIGKTFVHQQRVPQVTGGFTAFALDWWYGDMLAHELMNRANSYDQAQYSCLLAIFQLMCAGFLRQVSSHRLAVLVR